MAVKSSVFQRAQLGLESPAGTLATVNRRMPNLMVAMSPKWETKKYRGQGYKATNIVAPNKFWTDFTYDGPMTYGEMTWILASVFGLATPTAGAGASQAWAFAPSLSSPDTPATYTIEQGDFASGYRTRYGLIQDATFSITRDELKVSGKGIGQQFETDLLLTSLNALNTVTITGAPAGGTFTVTIGGQTTATIAYNATAAAVKTAIELLSSVGTGNSVVGGGALPGTPVTIKLTGPAGGQAITVNGAGLTGGSSPAIANVATGGTGAASVENVPMIASTVDVFIDPTFGGIGTTRVPGAFTADVGLTNRWGPEWILDSTKPSWASPVETVPAATLKLSMESNPTSDAFVALINAATTKYMRIQATGPIISGGTTYLFQLDIPFTGTDMGGFKDVAGVWTADWVFEPMSDQNANFFMRALLTNTVSAL